MVKSEGRGSPKQKTLDQLLAEAQAGSTAAVGEALDACRAYLLMVATREVDPALRVKTAASDIVQETFLEAQRDFRRFHGTTEAELLAWLRQVLLNNVANCQRRYRQTAKREIDLEVDLTNEHSSLNWQESVDAGCPTPSWQAVTNEAQTSLEVALENLPTEYRQVILYRYQEERSFAEIGDLMNRSPEAARKLWARAVERLEKEVNREK